jgi:hypothetical protein
VQADPLYISADGTRVSSTRFMFIEMADFLQNSLKQQFLKRCTALQ